MALAAVGKGRYSSEEEEKDALGKRPRVAPFSNVCPSSPGAYRTPFVRWKGNRNYHLNERSRENYYNRSE